MFLIYRASALIAVNLFCHIFIVIIFINYVLLNGTFWLTIESFASVTNCFLFVVFISIALFCVFYKVFMVNNDVYCILSFVTLHLL